MKKMNRDVLRDICSEVLQAVKKKVTQSYSMHNWTCLLSKAGTISVITTESFINENDFS